MRGGPETLKLYLEMRIVKAKYIEGFLGIEHKTARETTLFAFRGHMMLFLCVTWCVM